MVVRILCISLTIEFSRYGCENFMHVIDTTEFSQYGCENFILVIDTCEFSRYGCKNSSCIEKNFFTKVWLWEFCMYWHKWIFKVWLWELYTYIDTVLFSRYGCEDFIHVIDASEFSRYGCENCIHTLTQVYVQGMVQKISCHSHKWIFKVRLWEFQTYLWLK